MDEFSLINSVKQPYYRQSSLLKGIGDDAAVFKERQDNIVIATDVFVEDIHFSQKTMSPEQVGYRALAVNLSDLAAMGAQPTFYMVAIVVPSKWKNKIKEIYEGMNKLALEYQIDLIGGDTVSGEQLTITITVIGSVFPNSVRYRSHAKASDIVFVTETLGDSRAGLHILQTGKNYIEAEYFIQRHRYPKARIKFAQSLTSIDRLALNDISDGIISEAAEIATESKVDIVIDESLIPISEHFYQFDKTLQRKWKLFGGEDFELLGVTSISNWEKIKKLSEKTKTKVTKVGYTENPESMDAPGKVYLEENGRRTLILDRGYTHLNEEGD